MNIFIGQNRKILILKLKQLDGIIVASNINEYVIVTKIIERFGNKGQITKVRVRSLKNRKIILTRSVKGIIRLGDIMILKDCYRESE
uniref:Ribosomal protein S28 n=1 Tax=Amorphochlora amoebiformis TaxID=1561963 RepID=A0A0H5BKM3_9EUKA|nr:ribosomal protein S28 [Amorphochlora amoebiformis]